MIEFSYFGWVEFNQFILYWNEFYLIWFNSPKFNSIQISMGTLTLFNQRRKLLCSMKFEFNLSCIMQIHSIFSFKWKLIFTKWTHFFTNSMSLVMWSNMDPKFKVHVIFLWFPFVANFCHLAMKKMVFQLVQRILFPKKCPNFLDFKGLKKKLLGLDDKVLACHQNVARFQKQFTFLYDL